MSSRVVIEEAAGIQARLIEALRLLRRQLKS